jgi:HEAT repeat protein
MIRHIFVILTIAFFHSTGLAQAPPDPIAPLLQRLRSADVFDRSHAAKALGALGAAAEPAVPALVLALRDENATVAGEALEALCRIGTPAVRALVVALEGTDAKLRHQAAVALSRIEPTDPVAVKALVKALKDPSGDVRRRAALALENAGKAGKAREGVVVGLIAALADRDGTVRISAAVALGNIGADARDAAEPLSKMLKDDDAKFRTVAGEALRKITASKPFKEP